MLLSDTLRLALKILSGEFQDGDLIRVERGPEGLIFSAAVPEEKEQVVD